MIRLNKTPLPESIQIKFEKDYRSDPVFQILKDDCFEKCYLCEDKPKSINIEHLIPHKGNDKIKFDWNNLFLSCSYCNNIKSSKYKNIINPVKFDPEEHISFSITLEKPKLIDSVQIKALKQDDSVLETVILLDLIYNGDNTPIKKLGASNFRNHNLIPDIRKFLKYIEGHKENPNSNYKKLILKEILRSSKFTAFKRKIIRDDPELFKLFENDLNK